MGDRYDDARRLAYSYRDLFGKDNFFLEIQDHGLEQDKRLTPQVNRLPMETGIPRPRPIFRPPPIEPKRAGRAISAILKPWEASSINSPRHWNPIRISASKTSPPGRAWSR